MATEIRNENAGRRCAFCGQGIICEHGKCTECQRCGVCFDPDDDYRGEGAE